MLLTFKQKIGFFTILGKNCDKIDVKIRWQMWWAEQWGLFGNRVNISYFLDEIVFFFFFYIYQAIEGRWNQRSLSIVGMLNISIKADDVLVPLLGGVQSSADELWVLLSVGDVGGRNDSTGARLPSLKAGPAAGKHQWEHLQISFSRYSQEAHLKWHSWVWSEWLQVALRLLPM